ncbi:MAG: SMC-Scp complex subunit ScpB [Halieaceae bacterium]|jgi:segregation and condensation protein B|nr:SMC-Scp complex subunit ScpB [Halieaceae bacterium]
MAETGLTQIIEGALMAAGEPLSVQRIAQLFEEHERPGNDDIRSALAEVAERCEGHGFELVEVASGWRFQVRQNLAGWVSRLWQERPARYSRALLETLSLIAYRQPITRGEIEEIRGVAVSSNIIKTLQEREWVRIVGHRDVPGRPAMYATTRQFLDYFNLKSLEDLPPLAEIRDLDNLSGNLLAVEVEASNDAQSASVEMAANDDSVTSAGIEAVRELDGSSVDDASVMADNSEASDSAGIALSEPVADADEAEDNPAPATTGELGEAEDSLGAEDIAGQQEAEQEQDRR